MAEFDQAFADYFIERWELALQKQTEELQGDPTGTLKSAIDELKQIRQSIQQQTDTTSKGQENETDIVKKLVNAIIGWQKNNKEAAESTAQQRQKAENILRGGFGLDGSDTGRKLEQFSNFLGQSGKSIAGFTAALVGSTGALYTFSTWLDETTTSIRSMADVGQSFSGGLFELYDAAATGKMTLETFAESVKNAGAAVSALGLRGFAELQANVRESIRDMGMLGLTTEQIVDYLNEYIDIQRRAGTLDQMTQAQMQQRIQGFMMNVTALAAATGDSRDQIMKQISDAQDAPDFASVLNRLPEQLRGEFEQISGIASQISEPFTEMLNTAMAGMPAAMTDAGQELIKAGGGRFVEMIQNFAGEFRAGSKDAEDFVRLLRRAGEDAREAEQELPFVEAFAKVRELASNIGRFDADAWLETQDAVRRAAPLRNALTNMQDQVLELTSAFNDLLVTAIEPWEDDLKMLLNEVITPGFKILSEFAVNLKEDFENLSETTKQLITGPIGLIAAAMGFKALMTMLSPVVRLFGALINPLGMFSRMLGGILTASAGVGGGTIAGLETATGGRGGRLVRSITRAFTTSLTYAFKPIIAALHGIAALMNRTMVGRGITGAGGRLGRAGRGLFGRLRAPTMGSIGRAGGGLAIASLVGGLLGSMRDSYAEREEEDKTRGAQTLLTGTQRALQGAGVGMMFGPWGALIGAGLGLVFGVFEENWNDIVEWFEEKANLDWLTNFFQGIIDWISDLYDDITNSSLYQAIFGETEQGSHVQERRERRRAQQQTQAEEEEVTPLFKRGVQQTLAQVDRSRDIEAEDVRLANIFKEKLDEANMEKTDLSEDVLIELQTLSRILERIEEPTKAQIRYLSGIHDFSEKQARAQTNEGGR